MKQNFTILPGRPWLVLLMLFAWFMPPQAAAQNVTLDRNLYKDGKWNTLCLPFALDDEQIAASPLKDATIKELNTSSSGLVGNELGIYFTDATAIVAGKPYIVRWEKYLVIEDEADWKTFTDNPDQYDVVKLATDINVKTRLIGLSNKPFKGIFDGDGHTLTCAIDLTSGSEPYAAPFRYINGATIKNVKVTGTVNGGNYSAGLVGYASGSSKILSCAVSTTVTGANNCGGILGYGDPGAENEIEISYCLFNGTITGSSNTGMLYGYANATGTHKLEDCFANGTYPNSSVDLFNTNSATVTVTNCYKNQNVGTYGTYTTQTGSALLAQLGSEWEEDGGNVVPKTRDGEDTTITNPTFEGVTTDDTKRDVDFPGGCSFRGTSTEEVTFTEENHRKFLLLTGKNTLAYPAANLTIGKYRAYFELPTAGAAHSFTLDFGEDAGETTGIIQVKRDEPAANGNTPAANADAAYYDLQGRKLDGKPTQKGIYIVGGKKIIIH